MDSKEVRRYLIREINKWTKTHTMHSGSDITGVRYKYWDFEAPAYNIFGIDTYCNDEKISLRLYKYIYKSENDYGIDSSEILDNGISRVEIRGAWNKPVTGFHSITTEMLLEIYLLLYTDNHNLKLCSCDNIVYGPVSDNKVNESAQYRLNEGLYDDDDDDDNYPSDEDDDTPYEDTDENHLKEYTPYHIVLTSDDNMSEISFKRHGVDRTSAGGWMNGTKWSIDYQTTLSVVKGKWVNKPDDTIDGHQLSRSAKWSTIDSLVSWLEQYTKYSKGTNAIKKKRS